MFTQMNVMQGLSGEGKQSNTEGIKSTKWQEGNNINPMIGHDDGQEKKASEIPHVFKR